MFGYRCVLFSVGIFLTAANFTFGAITPTRKRFDSVSAKSTQDSSPWYSPVGSLAADFTGVHVDLPFSSDQSPISRSRLYDESSELDIDSSFVSSTLPTTSRNARSRNLSMDSCFSGSTDSESSSSYSIISESNASHLARIEDITGQKKITPQDAASGERHVHAMKETPGGSKTIADNSLVSNFTVRLFESPKSTDLRRSVKRPLLQSEEVSVKAVKNDRNLYRLRSSKGDIGKRAQAKVITSLYAARDSDTLLPGAVVDTMHSMKPEITRAADGKIRQISGGHDLGSYDLHDLDPVYFQSIDEHRRILSILQKDVKTVQENFDHDKQLLIIDDAKIVARNESGSFVVLHDTDGQYYGCHPDTTNALIVNSLFPIVVLSKDVSVSPSKPVKVGTIVHTSPGKTTIAASHDITLSSSEFDDCIQSGAPLKSQSSAARKIFDITQPFARKIPADAFPKSLSIFACTDEN